MPRLDGRLGAGIGFALAAGLAWGLVFVAPVLLPDYSPAMLTFGRYLAFGLVALLLAWRDRRALAQLSRADWLEALKLAAVFKAPVEALFSLKPFAPLGRTLKEQRSS